MGGEGEEWMPVLQKQQEISYCGMRLLIWPHSLSRHTAATHTAHEAIKERQKPEGLIAEACVKMTVRLLL